MPKISIAKNPGKSIEVERGTNLMKALLAAGVPVASSCRGDGACAKCRLRIVSGSQNLTKPHELEEFLIERYKLKSSERISCQCEVLGDVCVDATYW